MRHVQAPSSAGGSNQSDWTAVTSVSQQGGGVSAQGGQHATQQTQQQTQYRVSRISEMNSFDDGPEHFVCDLRDSPKSSVGSVRAIHFYIGDDVEENAQQGEVRTMITEVPSEDGDMCNILLDSGADAAVFPLAYASCGSDTGEDTTRLHDAQGKLIPVKTMRDVEIRLLDETGRLVLLKERVVAISPHVTQPILCYGRLLQAGWSMDSREQVLTHEAGVKVPIELQNMSVTVKGWVRVISSDLNASNVQQPEHVVRAVRADVTSDLRLGPAGWHLDENHCGVGRHHSNCFQDPTLFRPQMSGSLYRTTLLRDMGEWFVLELCEPMNALVDLGAEIYGYEGPRDLLTIITDSDKEPILGFSLLGDEPALFGESDRQPNVDVAIAPEDEVVGREIEEGDQVSGGAEVPLEGRIIFEPSPTDMVLVNGVELTPESSLQALRTGLAYYSLSTSGSKVKCFTRLLNHQKHMELQIIHSAAEQSMKELSRIPKSVDLKVPPSAAEQEQHSLTHLPYAPWCASCVCFRARADKQLRTDGARRSGVATISFDFCYTKAVPETMVEKDVDTMVTLVMTDSATGYLHAVPLRSKNQWSLMVRELLGFAGIVGHSELVFMCDNEPTLRQLLRMVVRARLAMGLPTRQTTSPPYSHGNSLVENAVGRIRPLAGTLMHFLSEQVGVEFSTNSPLWSWAFRHACFLLNRFTPTRGATPYEVLYQKDYGGAICNFGEPVFGFAKVSGKGTARWRRMFFLGKTDPQDTYLLFDGHELVITRSIRRIATAWRGHLAFYMNFRCWSWEYKTGFGGRILPTKAQPSALTASGGAPAGDVEPSAFFDEDAEAVRQKHLEEVREETELSEMTLHDKPLPAAQPVDVSVGEEISEVAPKQVRFPNPVGIFDDPPEESKEPQAVDTALNVPSIASGPSSSVHGPPVDVPQAPDVFARVPTTPRTSPSTRQHETEPDDHDSKRARVETAKKQRLKRISAEYATMVRTVKFAGENFHTMDEYNSDLSLDDHLSLEAWLEEEKDESPIGDMPVELWSEYPADCHPPEPESWVDRVADTVEPSRLCKMNVIVEGNSEQLDASSTLTTKFVYDWRLKDKVNPDGSSEKRWLRRSRLVAREFAFWEKRSDTYSPATSTHILNVLPMKFLQSLVDVPTCENESLSKVCLGTLDVKDAFLMVDQPSPMLVSLLGKQYTVKRNLPGQRLGAKSWYWHLRSFLSEKMSFEWCKEQPCLAKNSQCCIMVHVDDIRYCGDRAYWQQTFLPKFAEVYKISHSELKGIGSEISFLKRKICRTERGLALLPGTSAEKVVELYEQCFGKTRPQAIPCDSSIQVEDKSEELPPKEAFSYRSIVGTCLYLARDRPDLLFTVKELSGAMSRPTYTALQRLKKLVGYLKSTPDYCVLLEIPVGVRASGIQLTNIGCLKLSVIVTGVRTKRTEDQRAAECTCLMAHSSLPAQGLSA